MGIPRPEHPNPIFERKSWLNLNGKDWLFAIQADGASDPAPCTWDGHIKVPFCLQAPISGALAQLSAARRRALGLADAPLAPGLRRSDALWYRRELPRMPRAWRRANGDVRVLLHVGACDSSSVVMLNGQAFPEHHGGSTAFYHDITDALHSSSDVADVLMIKCTDRPKNKMQPCGKQFAGQKAYAGPGPHVPTLYSNITGIWQTTWLEAVSARAHLERVQMVPRCTRGPGASNASWALELRPELPRGTQRANLEFQAILYTSRTRRVELVKRRWLLAGTRAPRLVLEVPATAVHLWSPEQPYLYGLRFRLCAGSSIIDEVNSYTALRIVECRGDQIFLNGSPRYMRLVLDQGYYPDGLWTAPTEAALRGDILSAMSVGFNGARLHQKVFEPLFFKHADELGYMVISEYPDWNGGVNNRWEVTLAYRKVVASEWETAVAALHNHPSIIAWGLFNEFGPKNGWRHHHGAGGGFWSRYPPGRRNTIIRKHKEFVSNVVRRVRRRDAQRRPVHDSSGWIHIDTDLWSFHEYNQQDEALRALLSELPAKFVRGRSGQPLLAAEYGGVGLDDGGPYGPRNPRHLLPGYPGRGQVGLPRDAREALARIAALTSEIYDAPHVAGFCYTQLYDVEFEKNGLLRYDRSWKFQKAALRRIFDGRGQKGRWTAATESSGIANRVIRTIRK